MKGKVVVGLLLNASPPPEKKDDHLPNKGLVIQLIPIYLSLCLSVLYVNVDLRSRLGCGIGVGLELGDELNG
jgi:hypothetical protein